MIIALALYTVSVANPTDVVSVYVKFLGFGVWMVGWLVGWLDGWMDGWMDRWMDG